MSEATNFKNNKTGQQIDLVDQDARDQIETLNETLIESTFYLGIPDSAHRLTADDDLNDFTTAGRWSAITDSIASSIANSPTNTAFAMVTIQILNNYSAQIVIDYKNNIYSRAYNGAKASDNWTAWQSVFS